MPHYKCEACKTRLYNAGTPTGLVGDLCPGCGSLLEPVEKLAEVVGFRSIKPHEGEGDAPGRHQRIAERIGDLMARREARAQAELDIERWLHDGDGFSPEAMAQALALPAPEERS